jgi:hypothetical protein
VQFSPAERDGAEGEVLPGGAVPDEGLHAPGRRPGGGAAGGADVQRPEGAAAALSPAHRHSEGGVAGGYASSWGLGDRKPTQLLAAMVEACPRGQENSMFISALFLRKLPADVRILLAHMDYTRLKEMATAADQLVAMRAAPAAVAAVEADPGEVAAVAARGGGSGAGRRPAVVAAKQKKKKPGGGTGAIQGGQAGRRAVPQALAVRSPGLQL